jgi:hypothetical protein
MLWTIAVILVVLWPVGLVCAYALGGFIHILFLAPTRTRVKRKLGRADPPARPLPPVAVNSL